MCEERRGGGLFVDLRERLLPPVCFPEHAVALCTAIVESVLLCVRKGISALCGEISALCKQGQVPLTSGAHFCVCDARRARPSVVM